MIYSTVVGSALHRFLPLLRKVVALMSLLVAFLVVVTKHLAGEAKWRKGFSRLAHSLGDTVHHREDMQVGGAPAMVEGVCGW